MDDVDEVFSLQLEQVLTIRPRKLVKLISKQLYCIKSRKLLVGLPKLLKHNLALSVFVPLSLCKGKINKCNQDVVEVKVFELVVRGNLEFSNESEQRVLELALKERTRLKLVIFSATVVFFATPLCREGKQLFVAEVEQDFIGYFSQFKLDLFLDLHLLVDKVENEIFDLFNRNHTCSIRIVLLPKALEHFESFTLNLLLLIEKFAFETF